MRGLFGPMVAALVLAAPATASQLWVVDAAAGPGHDFTQLDVAIAAAGEGDTLLVRSGTYGDTIVFAKSLNIVAAPDAWAPVGEPPVVRGASVRGLAAQQHVLLAGLVFSGGTEEGLALKNNAGQVWVEDCVLRGADGEGALAAPDFHPDGFAGARVENSDEVAFLRCELRAGQAYPVSAWPVTAHGSGGNGLELVDVPRAVVIGCTLVGTDGGDAFSDQAATTGGAGGSGVDLANSYLVIYDSELVGGGGGDSGASFEPPLFIECADGGNAGDGVRASVAPCTIQYGSLGFQTGTPGAPGPFGSCNPGAPGQLIEGLGSTFSDQGNVAYRASMQTLVAAGGTHQVELTGPPNSLGFLFVSGAPAAFSVAPFQGVALVSYAQGFYLPVGSLPHSQAYAVPLTPSPGSAAWLYTQLIGYDLTTQTFTLGQAHTLAVLSPGV